MNNLYEANSRPRIQSSLGEYIEQHQNGPRKGNQHENNSNYHGRTVNKTFSNNYQENRAGYGSQRQQKASGSTGRIRTDYRRPSKNLDRRPFYSGGREMTPTSVHPLDKTKAHASDPIKQPKYDPSLSLDGEISKNLNPNKILS